MVVLADRKGVIIEIRHQLHRGFERVFRGYHLDVRRHYIANLHGCPPSRPPVRSRNGSSLSYVPRAGATKLWHPATSRGPHCDLSLHITKSSHPASGGLELVRSRCSVPELTSLLPSRRPVQTRPDPRCRIILAHPEDAAGRLGFGPNAPSSNKGARERRIPEIERDRVVQHPAHSRRCHRPAIGAGRRPIAARTVGERSPSRYPARESR